MMKTGQGVATILHVRKLRPLFLSQRRLPWEPLDSPCVSSEFFLTGGLEVEPNSDGGRTQRNSKNEANQDGSGGVTSKKLHESPSQSVGK